MGIVGGGDCCSCPEILVGPDTKTLSVFLKDGLNLKWWDSLEDNSLQVLFQEGYYWLFGSFGGSDQPTGHKANYNGNQLASLSNDVTQSDKFRAASSTSSGMACITQNSGNHTGYIYNTDGVLQGSSFAVDHEPVTRNVNCAYYDGDLWAQHYSLSSPFNTQIGQYDSSGFVAAYDPPDSMDVFMFIPYSDSQLLVILKESPSLTFHCCTFDMATQTFGSAVDMGWSAITNDGSLYVDSTHFCFVEQELDVRAISDLSTRIIDVNFGSDQSRGTATDGTIALLTGFGGVSNLHAFDASGTLWSVTSSNGRTGAVAMDSTHVFNAAGNYLEKRLKTNGSLVDSVKVLDPISLTPITGVYVNGDYVYVIHAVDDV